MTEQLCPTCGKRISTGKRKYRTTDEEKMIGNCLKCGTRLTFCGRPFSAEIRCRNCGSLNIFTHSQQPTRLSA